MDIEDFLGQDIDLARLRSETYGDVRDAVEALTAAALAVSGRMLAQYHEWLMHQLP